MGRRRPRRHKIVSGRHIFAVLIAVFTLVGGYAGYRLIMTEVEYTAAQNEYSQIRLLSPISNYLHDVEEPNTGENERKRQIANHVF